MAAQQQKMPKGLPKRVRNERAKAKRARSWERRQRRKAANIEANRLAWMLNEEYRKRGELTPYEARRAAYRK